MSLPDFLVIGAARSGTTSLHQYLREHPEIYIPRSKEPRYFALIGNPQAEKLSTEHGPWQGSVWDFEDYKGLFADTESYKVVGECSPIYMYSEVACENIHRVIPNTRLIAILRNPIDRAISHYGHDMRNQFDRPMSFEDYIDRHPHIITLGYYATQLEKFFQRFPEEQIKIVLFDDLILNSKKLIESLYSFLGVSSSFRPRLEQIHNAAPSSSGVFRGLFGKLSSKKSTDITSKLSGPKKMKRETRQELSHRYEHEIYRIEKLLDRDLSAWRSEN